MITYIIPTRNRPDQLAHTLDAISRLGSHAAAGGAEVIVADNASSPPAWTPEWLPSGTRVKLLRREQNEAAAARNAAAREANPDSDWLIMLDDDSHPVDDGFLDALRDLPGDVGAVAAEIFVPARAGAGPTLGMADGRPQNGANPDPLAQAEASLAAETLTDHEAGGLPEVFIGCGVAIRRDLFIKLGGYDATFDYYAEEYDLAARMLAAGFRVLFDRRFRVMHRKVAAGRDFSRIIRRLVRNNAWVAQRYAPDDVRRSEITETITRYAKIAWKERVSPAYLQGTWELAASLSKQPRSPLPAPLWDRLTGLHHARVAIGAANAQRALGRVAIVDAGKNCWAIERTLDELGIKVISDRRRAETLVIGTLSPGPMFDSLRSWSKLGKRVIAPWVEASRRGSTKHERVLVA